MDENNPITLIATIGSSPAVLTEALYALYEEGTWPVTRVEVITTAHGSERLNRELFYYGRHKGGFFQLCEELGIPPNTIAIPMGDDLRAVEDEEGNPLGDIRNDREDQLLAGHVQETVRRHCSESGSQVIALLSGGRKTMSSHLASAMQLFARKHDRMIHVLVNEPFEQMRDFYFPTAESRKLTPAGAGQSAADARDARLDVIDIPFIKLRSYLHDRLDFSLAYPELLWQVDRQLRDKSDKPVQSLVVDVESASISINGLHNTVKPEHRPFSILAFLAALNRAENQVVGITWRQVINEDRYRLLLHTIYRISRNGRRDHLAPEILEREIEDEQEKDKWFDYRYWLEKRGREWVLNKRDFSRQRHNLIAKLEEGLQTLTELSGLTVDDLFSYTHRRRDALGVIHKVPVPPEHIEIRGLNQQEIEEILEPQDSPED